MDKRSKNKKKVVKKKKKSGVKKFFAGLLFIALLGVVSFGAYSYYSLYKMGKNMDNKNPKDKVEIPKVEKDDPVNIFIVGVDIGDPKLKGTNVPKRTDTMMVMHYEPKEKKAHIVSVPRDTKVEINGKTQKINNAHAIGGMKGAIDSVQDLLGIDINYYVKLDYEGFRKVIDAIGGVDMPINYNMNYDDPKQNLSIHFQKGTVAHLDGKKAEEFFRWRKNNDKTGLAEGDIGRIKNQHIFIEKVIEKVKSPSIVFKLKDILDIASKYITTNMSPTEIISYGMSVTKVDSSNIKMSTIAGEGKYIGDTSYFIYDEEKSADLLSELRGSKPMSIDRSALKIKVLNTTKKNGLASNYAEYLKKRGYSNIETGNAKRAVDSKIIFNKSFEDNVVRNIKSDFKINKVEQGSSSEGNYDITVILGEDHDYIK
ncbi:LCP family protein [Clostridium sp. KNHs214]|uniref:LCP family protein n=1 Tax=Clostridium sp. KNHs214 TaxID=1540257 RepID=UPI0005552FFA|nr:LCP family protein [Clostridium sp. KNHs214]